MSSPSPGVGPPPNKRSHKLTERERELYFPNGAVVRAFPLFEIELSSSFVRLGYGPPSEDSVARKSVVRDSKTAKQNPKSHKDSASKRNRWKPLGELLGPRTMRFGLLLTHCDHLYPLNHHLLEEELFLPTDAASTRLHFLGNAEVSIEQFEDILLFHASLMFLLYGSNTLANDKTPAWTRFCSHLDYSIVAVPISSSTPPIIPTLPIRPDWSPSMTRQMNRSHDSVSYDNDRDTGSPNQCNETPVDLSQSGNAESSKLLKTDYAFSFIDVERLDTFLSSRDSEPYDANRHLPSSIIRSSYNDSWYTFVDRIPGEGLDSVLTFNGEQMKLRDFMASRWDLTDLRPTRALLLAVPVTFKIKLAANAFPSATKYILASVKRNDDDFHDSPVSVSSLPSYPIASSSNIQQGASSSINHDQRAKISTETPASSKPGQNQDSSGSAQRLDKTGRRLIPETARVLPVTLYDLNVASYLPSIIFSLQRRLCGYSLHNEIVRESVEDFTDLEPVTMATMEEALTCPSASHFKNYERLETLGDTALKYTISWYLFLTNPFAGEGALSEKKLQYISNKDLSKTDRSARIASECVPDQLSIAVKKRRCKAKTNLSMKSTADLCESTLGHFYFQWGEPGAKIFLRWIDRSHKELVDKANTVLNDPFPFYLQPPTSWDDNSHPSIPSFIPKLNYQFKRRHLLVIALSHPSAINKPASQTFERFEFLGDAVLDLVIVSLLFTHEHVQLKPGEMSIYRSQIASNANYAFLAILFKFHTLLIHNSPSVYQEQISYIDKLNELKLEGGHEDISELLGTKAMQNLKSPAALSDLFEAVAGAIFLDLGGDTVAFSRIYAPLLHQLVERYLELEVQELGARHPHAEFIELLQLHHCHSEMRITEDNTMIIVWHGLIIAQIDLLQEHKLDTERKLYQMALESLSSRPYIWEESCNCQKPQ